MSKEPNEQVEVFLEKWHSAVQAGSIDVLEPHMLEDVQLVSPALFHPKKGKAVVLELLKDVVASLRHYHVTKTWIDQRVILIEFDAEVDQYKIQGIDRVILNADGLMQELKVYIRPFRGLERLSQKVLDRQLQRRSLSWSDKSVIAAKRWLKKTLEL